MDSLGHRSDLAPRLLDLRCRIPAWGLGPPLLPYWGRRYIEALADSAEPLRRCPLTIRIWAQKREYTENSQLSPLSALNSGLSPPAEWEVTGLTSPPLIFGNLSRLRRLTRHFTRMPHSLLMHQHPLRTGFKTLKNDPYLLSVHSQRLLKHRRFPQFQPQI